MKEGVDALLLETFRYPEVERVLEEVTAAVRGAVPVFVSLWEWPEEPLPAAGRLVERGAAVLGLNCGPGATHAVALAGRLGGKAGVPLLVKPGSGPRAEAVMSPEELAGVGAGATGPERPLDRRLLRDRRAAHPRRWLTACEFIVYPCGTEQENQAR